MNRKTNHSLIVCLAVFLFFSALQSYAGNGKLYVATSKENYGASESVQFQVFLFNKANANNTVYVELLDCKGNIYDKKMLPLISGTSWSSVELPQTIEAEYYLLYCYIISKDTVETDCIKKVFINNSNPFSSIDKSKGSALSFFMEGGSFVAEMPNNLLISYQDENGNLAPANIKIVDEKNIILDSFAIDQSGYLKILFIPELKNRYFLLAENNQGIKIKKELPVATEYGATFSLIASKDSLLYTVNSFAKKHDQLDYKLEVLSNGETVYKADINFQTGLSEIRDVLVLKNLSGGFLTFRLTNNNNLVAQRTFYNEQGNNDSGLLRIIDTISKRSATITIPQFANGNGYLNLVLKNERSTGSMQDLSEQPVITNVTGNEITFNDLLIGWTKPSFKQTAGQANDKTFLTLSGTVYDLEKKIIKNKKINLIIVYRNLQKEYLVATTDRKGNFEVNSLIFFDTATVYCQLADNSDEKNNIQVDLKLSPSSSLNGNELKHLNFICASETAATDTAVINNNMYNSNNALNPGEKTLKGVTVKGAKVKTQTDKFIEENVSGQHNQASFKRNEFDFIANPQLVDNTPIFNFLRGRFNLIIDITGRGGIKISNTAGDGIGVYLNDMEVTEDLSIVSNLFVYELALVRYYSLPLKPRSTGTRTRFGMSVGAGGDLMIYTKKGFTAAEQMTKGLVKNTITGYDIYKPVSAETTLPVNPQSLYWKPNWSLQKQETIYIGLPANGSEKNVELIIEGINKYQIPFSFTKKVIFN